MEIGELNREVVLLVLAQSESGWQPAYPVRIRAIDGAINSITDYYACPWILAAPGSIVTSVQPVFAKG
jgi:RNA polymerase sigma-70 factor (ECF subfamily)